MPAASVVSSAAKTSLSRASVSSSASEQVRPVAKLTRLDGQCSCGKSSKKCTCKKPVKNAYSREVFQALNHLGGATWARRFAETTEEEDSEEIAEQLPVSRPPVSTSLAVGGPAATPVAPATPQQPLPAPAVSPGPIQIPAACPTNQGSLGPQVPDGGDLTPMRPAVTAGPPLASTVVESAFKSGGQESGYQTPPKQGGGKEDPVEEKTPVIAAREPEPVQSSFEPVEQPAPRAFEQTDPDRTATVAAEEVMSTPSKGGVASEAAIAPRLDPSGGSEFAQMKAMFDSALS